MSLEKARAEAAEHRAEFLRLHRDACVCLGRYFQALDRATRLTNATAAQNACGVPLPEEINKLDSVRITEAPVKNLLRSGLTVVETEGWNVSADVVPLVPKNVVDALSTKGGNKNGKSRT